MFKELSAFFLTWSTYPCSNLAVEIKMLLQSIYETKSGGLDDKEVIRDELFQYKKLMVLISL